MVRRETSWENTKEKKSGNTKTKAVEQNLEDEIHLEVQISGNRRTTKIPEGEKEKWRAEDDSQSKMQHPRKWK